MGEFFSWILGQAEQNKAKMQALIGQDLRSALMQAAAARQAAFERDLALWAQIKQSGIRGLRFN